MHLRNVALAAAMATLAERKSRTRYGWILLGAAWRRYQCMDVCVLSHDQSEIPLLSASHVLPAAKLYLHPYNGVPGSGVKSGLVAGL